MKSGLCVGDAMTVHPVVAKPNMTIREVAELMDRHSVGSVLVGTASDLVGIVTEADFVRRVVLEGYDSTHTPISEVMTRVLITAAPGMDLFDAVLLMRDYEVTHLPVIDNGSFVGFVTAKDILKLQPSLFETLVEVFTLREEERKLARKREIL